MTPIIIKVERQTPYGSDGKAVITILDGSGNNDKRTPLLSFSCMNEELQKALSCWNSAPHVLLHGKFEQS